MLSISELIVEFPEIPIQIYGDVDTDIGIPVVGFSVAISNDRAIFSKNESTFVVYDGKCMQCRNSECKQKVLTNK